MASFRNWDSHWATGLMGKLKQKGVSDAAGPVLGAPGPTAMWTDPFSWG